MLRPVLLIGVGGSGGKTLRAMRQSLLRKLHSAGWTKDQLPGGWQMLWVDSVTQQDEDAFPAPLLPNTQYAGLVAPGLAYADLRESLEKAVQPLEVQNALAGWVPENVPISVSAGAGQARAIGRAISAAQLRRLMAALNESHDRLTGVSVSSELAEVSSMFGQSDEAALTIPLAIVISSVAGGSGSGMFLDVIEALKTVDADYAAPDGIISVLYTPDVFGSIGGAGTQIPPNTLAAIMEVTAGVLAPGLSEASASLLQSRGVVQHSRHGFGTKCNFLVGASNANVSLGSQEDVYYAVGESLSAVVTDDKIQQTLRAFTLANVFLQSGNAMVVEDHSRLTDAANPDESMPFSAMGMGRVNLGTDRFAEYISLLTGRDITEQLLWPDFEARKQADGVSRTAEELIDDRVADRWVPFLEASRLNERDPANDIVDALTNTVQLEQRLLTWARDGHARASQGVEAKGMAPSEWVTRMQNYYDNHVAVIRAQELSRVYEEGQTWTATIQEHLLSQASEVVLRSGLTVASRLVEKLIDEMGYVVQELRTQVATKRAQTAMMSSGLQQALNVGAGKLSADDDALNKAVRALQIGAALEVDADRFEVAASLADDIASNLLRPMLNALLFARARVSDSVNSDKLADGRPNTWPIMPVFGKPVPTQLLPGSTERVLIQPDTYQSVLQAEVQACLKDDRDRQAWRSLLRERAALGQVLDTGSALDSQKPQEHSMFRSSVGWIPQDSKATTARVSGVKAEFVMPMSFEEAEKHVARYLSDAKLSTDVSKFLKQGLLDYVGSGTPAEQVQRENDFIGAFKEAVQISAPFAEINAKVKAALHPNVGDSVQALVSTIPFVEGERLYPKIKTILKDGGLWRDEQSSNWFATAKVSGISIFTMSGRAMLPMVFDNIMKPISGSWSVNSGQPSTRHAFWAMRRARPLVEAIPVGPRQLSAMLRGWFLTALLNQRTIVDEGNTGWRVQVWDSDSREFVAFPYPLLSAKPVDKEGLPAIVVKNVSIAMVKVNEKGSMAPLVPYQRLIDVGDEIQHKSIMSKWIKDGEVAGSGAPTPESKLAGTKEDTLDDRRDAVLKTLDGTKQKYVELFAEVSERRSPWSAPPVWELREPLLAALTDLILAAESVRDGGDTL